MGKLRKILIVSIFLFLTPFTAPALDVPPLHGHVNDYASMLSAQKAQELESILTDFERSESTQIVVLTIPTLAGENLEEYSIKVAEEWKIGQKDVDNGAILLIAKQERKVRIEVGRGLEGTLTDLISGRIIRGDITPRFKEGKFDAGISAGVASMMEVVKGEYKAEPRDLRQGKKGAPPILTLLIFLAVGCVFLGAISKFLGGLTGAIGLPVVGLLNFPGIGLMILAGLGVVGFLGGLFLSALFGGGGPRRGRRNGIFYGGGFGSGGFGGGGGFSSGGGGFSGGGGSFGGGGASGDW